MKQKHRDIVNGLADCASVRVGGKAYTGSYLAMIVAMNPNMPTKEASETPQLICELGRLTAIAYRAKQEADTAYRVWRDTTVHRMTNDMKAAEDAGFACVTDPGVDAKGNTKPKKYPSTSAVEAYLRTLPEYTAHYTTIAECEEAWSVLHTALEAAKQRTWVVRTFAETGAALPDGGSTGSLTDDFDDNALGSDFSGGNGIDNTEGGRTRRPPPPPVRR